MCFSNQLAVDIAYSICPTMIRSLTSPYSFRLAILTGCGGLLYLYHQVLRVADVKMTGLWRVRVKIDARSHRPETFILHSILLDWLATSCINDWRFGL